MWTKDENAILTQKEDMVLCQVAPPKSGIKYTLDVDPNSSYRVSAEISGDITVQCVAWSKTFLPKKRINVFNYTKPTSEFVDCSGTFKTNETTRRVYLNLFGWHQTGTFRVRNLTVTKMDINVKSDNAEWTPTISADNKVEIASYPISYMLREGFGYPKWKGGSRIFTDPSGWDRCAFNEGSINPKDRISKKMSGALEVNATSKGTTGWMCIPIMLKPGKAIQVKLKIRKSSDFSGAKPVVKICFLDKTKELLHTVDVKLPVLISDRDWIDIDDYIAENNIPKKAKFFRVFLGNSSEDTKAQGALWYSSLYVGRQHGYFYPRANRYGGWYHLGEEVKVKPFKEICAPDVECVIGIVRDSKEKELFRKRIDIKEFKTQSWSFKPAEPGFYLIEFRAVAGGKEFPVIEPFNERTVRELKLIPLEQKYLQIAVSSVPRDTLHAKWLGFSLSTSPRALKNGVSERGVKAIRFMGGSFIRMHDSTWADFEPERGKFNFFLDDFIENLGPLRNRSVLNIWGIPKWASSQADSTMQVRGGHQWKIVKPEKNEYTREFWGTIAKHYKKMGIHRYEIWNEPHFPGFSMFWNDTPENFLEMFKDASLAIRAEDPNAEIWFGGIGQRYLGFYDRMLKLGAIKYFDVLPFHGRESYPDSFRSVESKYGVKSPVYTSGEWHAVLISSSDKPPQLNPLSTEREISKGMLLDLLRMKSCGVSDVVAFNAVGWIRRDGLLHHPTYGNYSAQAIGLFDSVPYLMPRHCALVLHEFAAGFPQSCDYIGQYKFGEINGVSYSNDGKTVLVVWHNEDTPAKCPEKLSKYFNDNTKIKNWEGQTVAINGFTLNPGDFYYITNTKSIPQESEKIDVFYTNRPSLELKGPSGVFSDKEIVDDKGNFIPSNAVWNEQDWKIHSYGKKFDRSSRFAVAIVNGTFQLVIETSDTNFIPAKNSRFLWLGDSIQVGFDAVGKGYKMDRVELAIGKDQTNKVKVMKLGAPTLGGDLPSDYTMPSDYLTDQTILCKTEEIPGGMRYVIRLKQSELYPMVISDMDSIRFSLLINENDGTGRIGYSHWGDGIGSSKDPTLYGTIRKK
jgi:hypothetical protein